MADEPDFSEFIERIRAGDEEAAAKLVRQYEPAIRLEVRMRLSDPRIARVLDSMDICQSVLASFFARAALGQYDLAEPGQLVRLLVKMARNKLAFQVRHHRSQRRDAARLETTSSRALEETALEPSTSRLVAGKDLLTQFRRHLSPEERELADLRGQGWAWQEIAEKLGGTAQARRKQLSRAADRIAVVLGIDEAAHE